MNMPSIFPQILPWKGLLPATFLMGTAPVYLSLWSLVRIITLVLPHRVYQRADDTLYSAYQRMVTFFFFHTTNTEVIIYGDADVLKKTENVIFICNHQCTVDWLIANVLGIPPKSIGNIKYILKDVLKYFPLYGFYFKQHGCAYVKRGGKFCPKKLGSDVAKIKENGDPVWFVIFPEGTRYNLELTSVKERSIQYAKEEGFEILDNVLSPRIRALEISLKQLTGHIDSLYDVTIAYSNTQDQQTGRRLTAPSMFDFLLGKCPQVHINIERISIPDIPRDQQKLKRWLHTQFLKKDKLMGHFYANDIEERGRFPGKGSSLIIRYKDTLPAVLLFSSCLILLFYIEGGWLIYLKLTVIASLAGCGWMIFNA